MIRRFLCAACAVARVIIRFLGGQPRTPAEKIVFEASRKLARQYGGAA